MSQPGKLSAKTKLLFASGDIYGGGIMNIVNFFYAIFLTDICRIDPKWAGMIVLVARIWDAVTDPLMGLISDNTRTKMGRRRPYFVAGIPLILISFIMLWNPVGFGEQGLRVAYAMGAYVFLNTVTTLVMVPYQAMAAELTLDYKERTSVTTFRMIFSFGSTLVCAVLPGIIINSFADVRTGYLVMATFFGLLFALPYILVVRGTRENPEFMNTPRIKLRDALRALADPFRVRSFRLLIIMYLGAFVALDLISMIFSYYMTYHMGMGSSLSIVLGLLVICQMLFLPVVSKVSASIGKVKTFMLGCGLWALMCLSTWVITPALPGFIIYVVAALMGFSLSFPMVSIHAVFGDVTDAGELIVGRRMEGGFSGVQTFIRKCASAAANALALALLDATGYLKPVTELVGGVAKDVIQVQPASALFAIRSLIAFVPPILILISILAASRWPLTPQNHARLVSYLGDRRSGKPISQESEKTAEELSKIL